MSEAARDCASEIQRAETMMRAGQPHETIHILESVLPEIKDCEPEYRADIYSKLGTAYALSKQHEQAAGFFLKAIESDETLVKAYQNLCLSYTNLNEIEKAVEYGEKGLKHGPECPNLLKAVLNAKRLAWEVDDALALMERSPAFDRDDPFLLLNYGTLLQETGQKAKAHEAFAKTLEISPAYTKAHRMFSLVHSYTEGDPYLAMLHDLGKSQDLSPEAVAEVSFALAKAYEDTEDFEKAFEYYKQGNDQRRALEPFSHSAQEQFFNQIKDVFTPEYVQNFRSKNETPKSEITPIFIVGMPRSGTSLIEQILSTHTDVYGAGELRDLDIFLYEKFPFTRENFQDSWQSASDQMLKEIAGLYYERLERDANGERFITDKLPLNFINCGLIMCLFPHAKIIHSCRNPQPTCFSLYKTYFTGAAPFSNDQRDLAGYYRLYQDMMEHWHKVLPGFIHEVQYEDLVQNPEENIRPLLEYCGLEWQESCLEFHKTKRAVVTASAMQVKKPMYKGAIDYWKNFEPYMDNAILELETGQDAKR